jgi:hypothetical protein
MSRKRKYGQHFPLEHLSLRSFPAPSCCLHVPPISPSFLSHVADEPYMLHSSKLASTPQASFSKSSKGRVTCFGLYGHHPVLKILLLRKFAWSCSCIRRRRGLVLALPVCHRDSSWAQSQPDLRRRRKARAMHACS